MGEACSRCARATMGCVGVCIATATSAPFCAHEPCAGVVWASLVTRLGSFTQVWVIWTVAVTLFLLHCCYHGWHATAGCLTRHYQRTSYDCILGSSHSLIGVWWIEFFRLICHYVYNPSNNYAWLDAFTSMFKARTISSEKGAVENMWSHQYHITRLLPTLVTKLQLKL